LGFTLDANGGMAKRDVSLIIKILSLYFQGLRGGAEEQGREKREGGENSKPRIDFYNFRQMTGITPKK